MGLQDLCVMRLATVWRKWSVEDVVPFVILLFSAISESEKSKIRAQLITNFQEPVGPVATQLAVLISKVARNDCPRNWPELIPTLLAAIKRPEHLEQQRALLTYHHVVKTLAGKRLGPDRKLFQEVLFVLAKFGQIWCIPCVNCGCEIPGAKFLELLKS